MKKLQKRIFDISIVFQRGAIEHAVQPDKFRNILDSIRWSIATFTTVGYGDIYPVTAMGRVLSTVIAFLGIGLVAVPTGIISALSPAGFPKFVYSFYILTNT